MPLFRTVCLAAISLLVPLSAGSAHAEEDSAISKNVQRDKDAIRAVGETWRRLYTEGRFSEIPNLYTEDTVVMPRGRPRIDGRSGMQRAIGGLAAGRKVDIDVRERETVVIGNHGWFLGDFTVTYTPPAGEDRPAVTEEGRSLVIFRRDPDGVWRILRDIDSPAPELSPTSKVAVPMPSKYETVFASWDGSERSTPTPCDELASSKYDRFRLSPPVARADIDVAAAIAQCKADLERLPGDARLHFHLGRLYGYSGDKEESLAQRAAAARAGNHNAIFLLAYLDWIAASEAAVRCDAADRMKLAADRGNYSAQVTYSSYYLQGALEGCSAEPESSEVAAYLADARPAADGFFETRLIDHLNTQLELANNE